MSNIMCRHIVITNSLVKKSISHVNLSKSASPDLIHPNLNKQTQAALVKPLTCISQTSLDEGAIPEIWKCANVTAIFKSGEKSKSNNYRPISLIYVPGKTMERIIRDALVNHMTTNNLFCDEQHGFIKGKSCVTQLLRARLGTRKTGLSPPIFLYWPFQGDASVVVPCCYLFLLSVFVLWFSYYVSDIFCKF